MMMLAAKEAVSRKSGIVKNRTRIHTCLPCQTICKATTKKLRLVFPDSSFRERNWQGSHAREFLCDGCVCEVHAGYERGIT